MGSTRTGGTYQSIADQNFGVQGGPALPQLNSSNYTTSKKKFEKMNATSGYGEVKSQGSNDQSANEILFLKRLLFLKASLDNETTLNNFPVSFNDTKVFKSDNGLPYNQMNNFDFQSEKEQAPLMLTNGEDGP